jgi:adenylate cyclase
MTDTGPTRILAPPLLVLALAAALEWSNLMGLQGALSRALFGLWDKAGHSVVATLRPAAAWPAETLALLVLGGITVLLAGRARIYWAGLWTGFALAAGFEISWILFVSRHWLIDAASPGLGLVLVFAAGALAKTAETQHRRVWLRTTFFDSLPRAMVEKIAHNPKLLNASGQSRRISYLVCGIPRLATMTGEYRGDPQGFTDRIETLLSPLLEQVAAHGGTIDRISGEGFAACWNAPLDDPEHALHACQAAHAMLAAAGGQL